MDDVSWIILGLLVVIGLPAMAISAFVMVIRLKRRVAVLEGQVERLAAGAGRGIEAPPPSLAPEPLRPPEPSQPSERAQDGATPLPPPPEPVPEPSEPVGEPEPGPIPELAAASAPADVPQRPRASLEETLGARWAVWVGGLALALGGIFLVRYSIESGLLGPGARVVMGFLFGCGLVALGEVLRRRGPGEGAQPGAAYIPGIVTAAGTAALFATVYAAHALYGFIGPGPAFVLLGLVGIATMAAAALHGPGLAGLGLVGSYAVPLLVSSNEPNPWALTLYLIVVTAAALALARLRMWRWLAIAASVGSLGWGVVAVVAMAEQDPLAIGVYCLALALLTSLFLVVDPHRGREASGFDPLALLVMSGVAALVSLFAATLDVSTLALLVALAVAAGLLASALAFDAVAPATALAALVVLAVLIAWPLASSIAAEPVLIAPDMSFPPLTPVSLISFVAVAVLCAGALFAATTLDHLRRPGRAVPAATALALGAVGGALLILACAYVRGTNFTANIPFAACALAFAGILAASAGRLLKLGDAGSPAQAAAGAIHAAGAPAALALALTMVLQGSHLTTAFALAALGAAWVSSVRPIGALRWSAAGLAALVMLRMGGAWSILGDGFASFPTWTDIGLRYAVPALAFGIAGRFLRAGRPDTPAAILDGASIVLGAMAGAFAVRLWVQGPAEAMTASVTLEEAGLYATLAFAAAFGFARGAVATTSPVHRLAAPAGAVVAVVIAALGPLMMQNPIVTGDRVGGGAFANSLLLGYLLPAVLAAVVARAWSKLALVATDDQAATFARRLKSVVGATAVILAFAYVSFETKVLVSGPEMNFDDIPPAESYAFSAVWLVFGIALLAGGLVFGSKGARLGSAVVIMLTVAKVFLIDMSDLEGAWRALSFIGLGAVLIGIGLVYQRLLFRRSDVGAAG